ncbi:MAG: fibronectin type III domain-containing protein, partial [Xanthomonadales bacterium]|nr:fibronectin type III domain-containing protein [Xanthomonadales bacterium]
MKFKSIFCASSCLVLGLAMADKPGSNTSNGTPTPLVPQVKSVVKFDVSMPMHMMTPKPIVGKDKRGGSMIDPGEMSNDSSDQPFVEDGALQSVMGALPGPVKVADFFAMDNIAGVSPPDPAGDVGPNHYVAMTNLFFAVFDKAGTVLYGPAANNTVWSGFGGACEAENSGDPIVLYDQISDRWLLSQFTSAGPDYYNCVAVSTTPDPTGSYYRWAVRNNGSGSDLFPDYPKYGVWSDGFYISTRDFDSGYAGVGVYALKRDDIVNGVPNPTIIYFFVDRSTDPWQVGDGLLPADIDGSTLPPPGSPQYFVGTMDDGGPYGAAQDAISFWEFHADFDTPANSTFTRTAIIPIASYDTQYPCGGGRNCIPQAGTTNLVDIQSYRQRALHRLAYRNFGTHESLVTNQSVEAAPSVGGIRWWEIRDPDNSPTLYQEGTYAPGVNDGIHRWMASIAMDQEGNMGLAYSASSSSINPAIRFTGRLASDALGVMDRTEGSIIDGTGSQTTNQRWGDYTSTNIDPVDDCTFWHVNEYYDSNGGDWQIRVGSFKFNECGDPGFTLSSPDSDMAICVGDDANFDINAGSIGQYDGVVTLVGSGEPAGSVASFTVNPIPSLPGSTVLNITNTGLITSGAYTINVAGTSPTVDPKDIDLMLQVYDAVPSMPTLTSPADGAMNQDTQPSLNWTGSDTIEYTIEVATDMAFNNVVFTGNTTGNTIVPTTDLDTNTIYYWRVVANNSCGDSMYSQVFSFTTVAAPGDCSIGQTANTIYEYDFESGLNSWSTGALTGADEWNLSTARAHSGAESMLAVNVAVISDQVLTSPPIVIPSGETPVSLSFWNHQTMEDRTGGCYDGGILEVSTDGGNNYTQVDTSKMLT